ncbi:unnamed protein product [Zymoseptoria tritici ST99CH_3D1]|nr:unnamed protein product [Zymoseptoria tritici ST99CH_3D1]
MESRLEAGPRAEYSNVDVNLSDNDTSTHDGQYNEFASFQQGQRHRRTIVGRIRALLGMSPRRRGKAEGDVLDARSDGLLKKRYEPAWNVRREKETSAFGWLVRVVWVLPLVLLSIFGILHLLQVFIGSARLLWDLNTTDAFLPDFGTPGHIGAGLANYPTDATRNVQPIPCHSHNDYWRRVPLFEAIHYGCTSVEADVWKFDEELFVGHDTASLTRNRTLQSLYVNPLVDLLDRMNDPTTLLPSIRTTPRGIFDEAPEQSLVLLIDFKTNGAETFPLVLQHLEPLRAKDYLTYHDGTILHSRPITIVVTGNAPFDLILNMTTHRDVFFDAPLSAMFEPPSPLFAAPIPTNEQKYNTTNSLYASVSFTHAIGFPWRGRLSSSQLHLLRGQIRGAHRRGLKVRYWDTPGWPVNLRDAIWGVLMEEGVDVLNVDDLRGAAVGDWRRRVHGFW